MGKSRKRVSAALHSELSEYSSLIRALRTGDTLDLASQLTRPATSISQRNTPESDEDQEDVTSSNASTSRNVSPNTVLDKGKGRRLKNSKKAGSSGTAKAKDNWTRWPLLAEDIHPPEFEFRDEIKALALHIFQNQRLEDSNDANTLLDDDDDDTILPPSLLDSLTLASATHLAQVLSALAAHIPLMEKSMQNRIKPIGWGCVLDIVAATGLVDANIIEDIQERMGAVYGASERFSFSRAQSNLSAKRKLDDLCARHALSFLELPDLDMPPPQRKKRRRVAKKSESSPEIP